MLNYKPPVQNPFTLSSTNISIPCKIHCISTLVPFPSKSPHFESCWCFSKVLHHIQYHPHHNRTLHTAPLPPVSLLNLKYIPVSPECAKFHNKEVAFLSLSCSTNPVPITGIQYTGIANYH